MKLFILCLPNIIVLAVWLSTIRSPISSSVSFSEPNLGSSLTVTGNTYSYTYPDRYNFYVEASHGAAYIQLRQILSRSHLVLPPRSQMIASLSKLFPTSTFDCFFPKPVYASRFPVTSLVIPFWMITIFLIALPVTSQLIDRTKRIT